MNYPDLLSPALIAKGNMHLFVDLGVTNEMVRENLAVAGIQKSGEAGRSEPLRVADESAVDRDPEAVSFLKTSGLPLSAVVLGLFDQSDDCIKLISPSGRLQFMNCNGRQALEIDDFSAVCGCSWDALWPEVSRKLVQDAVAQAKEGKLTRFEAFCPTAKGTPKWWDVTVSPIRDADGNVAAILSSSRDVTDRKLREDAFAAIAAEMKHRLRNALTIGAALSMAMGKDQPQHRIFAAELASRLIALAEVQAALVDAADVSLSEIIERILKAFAADREGVVVGAIPALRLDEQRAKALVLVVGELATNSVKHGALSGRGSVTIHAALNHDQLTLCWHEVHRTSDEPASHLNVSGGGFGQRLMSRMLDTVDGSIDAGATADGYSAKVTVRL